MGCLQFGDKASLAETTEIVARCLDLGINFFDSANSYSDGLSEEYLGKALGSQRQQAVLATKVGSVRFGQRRKMVRDSSPPEIRSALEGSLRRLNTDYSGAKRIAAQLARFLVPPPNDFPTIGIAHCALTVSWPSKNIRRADDLAD